MDVEVVVTDHWIPHTAPDRLTGLLLDWFI